MRPTLLALLAALLLAPLATAHGLVPEPKDPYTLLIQDRTDDCGPESAVNDCHGSDALVGLVVQEKWDGGQDQVVFRFYLDIGKAGTKTDTLTFTSPAGPKTLSISSTDDKSFSGNGFDAVSGAIPVQGEATRFLVDATLSRAHLGVAVGDHLDNFKVVAKNGNNEGDTMPGDCKNSIGNCNAAATDERAFGYDVRGPGYYAGLDGLPQSLDVPLGGDTPVQQLTLTNSLTVQQTLSVRVDGLSGVSGGFHAGDQMEGADYAASRDVALQGRSNTVLHLRLHGDQADASGTLTITLDTDQGGHATYTLPYHVVAGSVQPTDTASSQGQTSSAKGSPTALAPLVGLVLLGLAARRRS
jgi:MYXO-CTERM domain-containing protein